jgi:hypothetical protein
LKFFKIQLTVKYKKFAPMNKNYFTLQNSVFFLLLFISFFSYGQTNTWNGSSSSNWNTAANWSLNRVPLSSNDVVIPNNFNVDINTAAVCKTLVISGGNKANIVTINDNNSLTVSGSITINAGDNKNDNKILAVGAGSLTAGSISILDTTNDDRVSNMSISTGTVNIVGNITMGSNSVRNRVVFTGGGTLNLGGTMTGGGLTTSTGTVNYNNNGNQNIGLYNYYNLSLTGTGIKTFGVVTTISNLMAISSGAIANLGNFQHIAGILTLGGAGPLTLTWGSTSSNPVAQNTSNFYFSNTSGRITVTGSIPYPAIDNNFASYVNGVSGDIAGSAGEYDGNLSLSAPAGSAFINVKFASYGSPGGTAPNFTIGACHAFNSRSVTTSLLGSNIATIPSTGSFNNTFGDPCYGVVKLYNVVVTYAQPFCIGSGVPTFVINGSSPTGGNNNYSYLWEVSTTSALTGYSPATGANNNKDYTVPDNVVTATRWYKRTVTSGIYSDATIVIIQAVSGSPTAPTNFEASIANCAGRSTLTVSGGSLGGLGGYAEFATDPTFITVAGTLNNIPGSITVNPTVGSTTYYVRYKNSCAATGSLIASTTNSISITAASATPICFSSSSQLASISYSATSGSPTRYKIDWDLAANTAGFIDQLSTPFTFGTDAGTLNNVAIPAGIVPGTYLGNLVIITATPASCESFGNIISITIKEFPTAPIPSNIIQTTCTQLTGSVTLSGLPSGNWTINANPVTTGLTGLTGSSATSIITGLAANTTYTFTVSNGTCSSLPSAAAVLNPVITTTYNGTTWDNGIGLNKIGIINPPTAAPITISSDVELCSCTVNAGKNLEIAPGITLKLQDRLTVSGTGSLTFNDEASLVQINNVTNLGDINYVRLKDNAVRVTDYTYYSSPVSLLKLAGSGGIAYNPTSHSGSRFFSWAVNSNAGFWQAATASTTMEIGKGYIVRGPNTVPGTPFALLQSTFTGVPNNGTITLPDNIIANNFYLLGNPYPSALDADAFLAANNSVLNGTIYFWTHATAISNSGSGFLQYSSNDYAAYNGTGSVATTRGNLVNGNPNESNKPNGKIAAGQGFFASSRAAPGASAIIFNNNMRVVGGGILKKNSQFFRTSKTNSKTTTGIEKNRIWLNLTNSGGAFKQLLVGYITGATNEYDSSFDGTTYNGNAYIDFYSLAADKNLTIQGRALPFSDSDLVPLGYVSKLAGEFSIAIDEVDGVLKSQDVFIEDKMLATVHDLKVAPYKFNTAIGTFSDRFVLRYTNRTLSTENFDIADNSIIVSKDKNELKIKSQIETIQRITIFNLLGKKVLDQNGINSTEFRSSNSNLTNQTAIVKITLTSGIVISKKVAF